MPKAEESVLEIDLNALAHNFKTIKSQLSPGVKFMSVIKAYAYGNDSVAMAKKLEELDTDYFAVAYTEEGIKLREAGVSKPILILHPQPVNYPEIIENCLEPNLYSARTLQLFIDIAEKQKQKNYPVHLKFNTGMNRLGFTETNYHHIPEKIGKTESVKVVSAFSHLAASEDWKEREFTLSQIYKFKDLAGKLIDDIRYEPLLHLCNTSAIFNYPSATFSMVRSGLGLYGFANDPNLDEKLKPVGTLKTVISQIQNLKEGDTVGYSRAFKAEKITKTATIPIGHADGIKRIYGHGKAGVFVNGEYAPIVGNVCMDIIMIDVTHIDCQEGDEVIIFGGPQHVTKLAGAGGTISYELITGISQRVKRVIIQ
ncbi:alanine racemase [Salegentibacter salinarum]|uniref:Alanine racemase n=1 Tax=Salegentibacter salinarum TaxID=447422 RepID=A0A2N0U3J8_9FLAO|nr:alanine racemase [Salegentibacter salinarum]PKD21569.1 alanine racemase [Salegentibacter salinarum]SKB36672.1 alanine racemase [Salegentibacter salinarum]